MSTTKNHIQVRKFKESTLVKIALIVLLGVMLLIPAGMVRSLKNERMDRQRGVLREINGKWGEAQTLSGPIISIPYKEWVRNAMGEEVIIEKWFHLLPEKLDISGDVAPEIRRRGIYEAVLYQAEMVCSGRFNIPESIKTGIPDEHFIWEEAMVTFGITDLRGITDIIEMEIGSEKIEMFPTIQEQGPIKKGVSAKMAFLDRQTELSFNVAVKFKGSQRLFFTPVGSNTKVSLSSSWSSPSFTGAFLPAKHEVNERGFEADWNVFCLNRSYPKFWTGNQYQIENSSFGLSFFIPADIYQKSERALKYAIMFILFTFAALFISEIILKMRIHPVQYILIGAALVVFYILLLSIGEHFSFNTAYVLASSLTILLISLYSLSLGAGWRFPITLFSVTTVLYGYLFIMLQLGDFALLMGSSGLFVVLAFVMFATRKVDWYTGKINS